MPVWRRRTRRSAWGARWGCAPYRGRRWPTCRAIRRSGGTAKGHLVREIDALGGLMGQAIDATAIQFKLLNRSRGPAVWSPRAQADKQRYGEWMRARLEREPNIGWIVDRAGAPVIEGGRVVGVELESGDRYGCRALVVTTGTFLNGVIHIGREERAAGRAGEPASRMLGESLRRLGLVWGRLKTGTPPRLNRRSIDFSRFEGGAWRSTARAFFLHDWHGRKTTDLLSRRAHERGGSRVGATKPGPVPAVQRTDHRYWPALLSVARGQGQAVPGAGAASGVLGAGGAGRSGDLCQWLFDEPAAGCAGGGRESVAGVGGGSNAASRLRDRVRLHPAHGATAHTRDAVGGRVVLGGTDQRDIGVRGSGGAGAGGRGERRAVGAWARGLGTWAGGGLCRGPGG